MPLYLGENRLITCSNNKSNAVPIPPPIPPPPPGTSGPVGSVQLSSGPGGTLTHNPDIYVSTTTAAPYPLNSLVLDSSNASSGEPITGLVFKKPTTSGGIAYIGQEGAVVYGNPDGQGVDFYGWKGATGPWISLTNTGGGATAAGGNKEIQYNSGGNFAATTNFTFDTTIIPNVLTVGDTTTSANTNLIGALDLNGSFDTTETAPSVGTYIINAKTSGANPFPQNPAISIGFTPSIASNATGIKIATSSFAGINLETDGGNIKYVTDGGSQFMKTNTGAIRLIRDDGTDQSKIEISPVGFGPGDIRLSTTANDNEIRLNTGGTGAEILIATTAAGTPIELNASGSASDIKVTANGNINATCEILHVTNNASTGSTLQLEGPSGDNIIITGTDGTIQLGAAGTQGDLQIKNTPSDIVGQLNVDANESGQLTLYKSSGGSTDLAINLKGDTATGIFGGTNTNGKVLLNENTSTNITIDSISSTITLVGKTGTGAPIDAVEFIGQPTLWNADPGSGAQNFGSGFAAASATNSGIAATIYGGLTILPNRDYNSAPNTTMFDANIIMGQYAWNTTQGPAPTNIFRSNKNIQAALGYGGSGNIYCNQVRQNIYSSGSSTSIIMNNLSAGFTGNGNNPLSQYYNGGNVRYLTVATNQEPNLAKEIILPSITEAMLGMTITIVRLRQNPQWYPGNNTAGVPRSEVPIYFYPTVPDLISCPDSIFVQSGSVSTGGIALDPFAQLVGTGYTTPSPYTRIGSATVVASSYGDGQLQQGIPSRYYWHYIDAYPGA